MTVPDTQLLTRILADQLVNTAAAGVVLAGLVWLLLRLAGRQNARTRFAVWFSVLVAIAVLPLLPRMALAPLPLAPRVAIPHAEMILPSDWGFAFLVVWLAGMVVMFLRLGVGLWTIRTVRQTCTEVDPGALSPVIAAAFRTFESSRHVSLCTSQEVEVPAVIGLFRPTIVFPESLLPQLSLSEIEMVVRHELAHVSRWDDWTNFAQKLVKSVFFFHPAVWWIESRLTLEREIACDDAVLAQTSSPRAYASSLISFAEKLHCARGLALAQALLSRVHQMSVRVAEILEARPPNHSCSWKPVFGWTAGLLLVALGAAPYTPQLVAFQSPPSTVQSIAVADSSVDRVTSPSLAVRASLHEVSASHPNAIAAAFHSQKKLAPKPASARVTSAPLTLRTSDVDELPATIQETIFILRASPLDSAAPSGSEIWTLCIWKVNPNNPKVRQLESAIVVRWI